MFKVFFLRGESHVCVTIIKSASHFNFPKETLKGNIIVIMKLVIFAEAYFGLTLKGSLPSLLFQSQFGKAFVFGRFQILFSNSFTGVQAFSFRSCYSTLVE